MAMTNPAVLLYGNIVEYTQMNNQPSNTPKTGLLGKNSNFKNTKVSSQTEEPPVVRAANYFNKFKEKRNELKNGNNTTT